MKESYGEWAKGVDGEKNIQQRHATSFSPVECPLLTGVYKYNPHLFKIENLLTVVTIVCVFFFLRPNHTLFSSQLLSLSVNLSYPFSFPPRYFYIIPLLSSAAFFFLQNSYLQAFPAAILSHRKFFPPLSFFYSFREFSFLLKKKAQRKILYGFSG